MASLTHVYMWDKNGWKHISAEDAARIHPGGTVSARSGLFMCGLCGQYVTLTDGNIRVRYFKHSTYEKSKECPERTFGADCLVSYEPQDHDLPIRITAVSKSTFRFEVGLIRAPISALSKDFRVLIQPKGEHNTPFIYAKERLNHDSITYLSIGEQPFEGYTLSFQNGNEKLKDFWPPEIKGVNPEGTLFEKLSGRMLPYDADIEINKEYYLLKRSYLSPINSESKIRIKEVVQKRFSYSVWRLFVVSASDFNENAARFFLDFHCRLTGSPVTLKPVWPLFIESSFLISHNQNSMYMLVSGNATAVKAFPNVAIRRLFNSASHPTLYEVYCSGRQQLISAGRTQVLQYTYIWKEPLSQEGVTPRVSVTDLTGAEIPSGEMDALPQGKTIRVTSSFDGAIVVSFHGRIIDKREVLADKLVEMNDLTHGLGVEVYVGLDCIWEVHFRKQKDKEHNDEMTVFKHITNVSGVIISAPHSLRNILNGMRHYPRISQWIRGCIAMDLINEQSYRRLQEFYRNMKMNRQGEAL